jgi:hypothetical protein
MVYLNNDHRKTSDTMVVEAIIVDDVSQRLSSDSLAHEDLARSIINHLGKLPPGSVIAVQGSWGRGKTDVIQRVHDIVAKESVHASFSDPLWINPWQYGSPNLIAPLVVQLVRRIGATQRSGSEKLRLAAQTLLRAGNAIAFKALSVFVPFGAILEPAKEPVDDFISQLFDEPEDGTTADIDPVYSMGQRFRELVDEYLLLSGHKDSKLVVCIDDLDRCLPDHQIAMLEAIYFLTAAGANAYFLVALDPTLVSQAAATHYKVDTFDTNQYLDKLFNLRINLRSLRGEGLSKLMQQELAVLSTAESGSSTADSASRDAVYLPEGDLQEVMTRVFTIPELTNPRLVHRVIERLRLFIESDPGSIFLGRTEKATMGHVVELITRMCVISERWPQLRSLLQASPLTDDWGDRLDLITVFYGWNPPEWSEKRLAEAHQIIEESRSFFGRLPDRVRHPDLGEFLFYTNSLPDARTLLPVIDRALMSAAL